jgi:hypothetical protein
VAWDYSWNHEGHQGHVVDRFAGQPDNSSVINQAHNAFERTVTVDDG